MRVNKEILNALITISSTLLGVVSGGIITYKLNLKFQNKVIKKQIKVEELKTLLVSMYDYRESLLKLAINFTFYHDNKSKFQLIDLCLSESTRRFYILEKGLYLNKIMFEEYDESIKEFKKDSNIMISLINYKISSFDEEVEEYEEDIMKKPIKDRINDLIDKIEEYIKNFQQEYMKEL